MGRKMGRSIGRKNRDIKMERSKNRGKQTAKSNGPSYIQVAKPHLRRALMPFQGTSHFGRNIRRNIGIFIGRPTMM